MSKRGGCQKRERKKLRTLSFLISSVEVLVLISISLVCVVMNYLLLKTAFFCRFKARTHEKGCQGMEWVSFLFLDCGNTDIVLIKINLEDKFLWEKFLCHLEHSFI